jgi:protocatechuate 3,4-dioxygenase beta subunit
MKNNSFFSVALLIIVGISGWLFFKNRSEQLATFVDASPQPSTSPITNCIPTFVDGGGPYYLANAPFRSNLAPTTTQGEQLTVSGKVLARDCITPLSNVTIDIWQANESGNYEDEWYRGQITTDNQGNYSFVTVVPKGYGEGTAFRPPHIHFKIWQNGSELITSQMFLPASRAQGIEEAYIMKLETSQTAAKTTQQGYHNIIIP